MRRTKPVVLAVVGRGLVVEDLLEQIACQAGSPYRLEAALVTDVRGVAEPAADISGVGRCADLSELLRDSSIDALVLDHGAELDANALDEIYDDRVATGRPILDATRLYEDLTGRVPIAHLDRRWFLRNPRLAKAPDGAYPVLKRAMDLALCVLLSVALSPLMLLTYLLVRLTSSGPALYVQERTGHRSRPFHCYKFRTMAVDAEALTGPVHSTENDTRLTRIGGLLRKTRLDELPQLFNILRGDLSFVGPRPIREHFAATFRETVPFYELRQSVQPGLTGWAQVHGWYAVPHGRECLEYDLYYIEHRSLWLDLRILLKTVRSVLRAEGK